MFLVLSTMIFPVEASIQTVGVAERVVSEDMVLVDARTIEQCLALSVSGARCLPANTFFAEDGRLASFYDISWVLGTLGLSQNDKLLVFADKAESRDAVAGLLFLSGQLGVWRWTGKMESLQDALGKGSGQVRGITRKRVYTGTTRGSLMVFDAELDGLRKSGWVLSSEKSVSGPVKDKTIVSASSPMLAISRFAGLMENGPQLLKVMIDQPGLDSVINNKVDIRYLLVLIFVAILLAGTLWKFSRRR